MKNIIKIYNASSQPQKAALWYVICNFLQKGIAFLVIPLYIRYLTASEYGEYTIFQSWCSIITIFATLNLYCGVFTKAMVDYKDDRDAYTSSMQGLSTVITLLYFFVFIFNSDLWTNLLGFDKITIFIMFLYFIAFPSYSFWNVRQRVENKYKTMVAITLAQSLLTPTLSLALLFYTDLRANAIIWGFLFSQVIFGLYFYIYNFIRNKTFYHRLYWRHAVQYNIPLIPHYLSLIVLGQIDRILIGELCGKDKAGIYGLAFQISNVLAIAISGINGSLVPWIYEKFKMSDFESVRLHCNRLSVILAVFTFLAMILTPDVIKIIGTPEYYEAIWIMPAVTLSVFVTFCYGLYSCVEFYYNETKYVMIATLTGALLSLIMNILLLPRLGFLSAGYTSLTCYTVFMIMHYYFMRKVCKKHNDGYTIFDARFLTKICLFLFVMMFISVFLYTNNILRYLMIMTIFIILLYKRNQIQSVLINK